MGKKFIYNVLLNIGLIALVFTAISAYKSDQYFLVIGAVCLIAVFSFLKIKLLKQVRELTKNPDSKE